MDVREKLRLLLGFLEVVASLGTSDLKRFAAALGRPYDKMLKHNAPLRLDQIRGMIEFARELDKDIKLRSARLCLYEIRTTLNGWLQSLEHDPMAAQFEPEDVFRRSQQIAKRALDCKRDLQRAIVEIGFEMELAGDTSLDDSDILILKCLNNAFPRRLRIDDIAAKTRIGNKKVGTRVNELIKDGYVIRENKSSGAAITDMGRSLIETLG